jgi:hypothetical protein
MLTLVSQKLVDTLSRFHIRRAKRLLSRNLFSSTMTTPTLQPRIKRLSVALLAAALTLALAAAPAQAQLPGDGNGNTTTLEPLDDTYIQGSTGDVTNGDSPELVVKYASFNEPDFVRHTYYKFDLSGVADGATIDEAVLSVYHQSDDDPDSPNLEPTDVVYGLDDVGWKEETASYGNPPGGSYDAQDTQALDDTTYEETVAGRLEFDVTGRVQSQLNAGADLVTFKHERDPVSSEEYVEFSSKENSNGNTPQLVITGDETIPVEFAGAPKPTVDGRRVTLAWRTLTETDNAGFFVQHKREAASGWTSASDRVPTKAEGGTASGEIGYRHEVTGLAPGRYRFRVQQVDIDGDRSASPATKLIEVGGGAGFALDAPAPNPLRSGQTARLSFSAPGAEDVSAVLFNSLGQKVRTLDATGGAVEVAPEGLSSGVYFVRLEAGERTATEQITLVR